MLHSSAADRNKDEILNILKHICKDKDKTILEIAAGSGQHSVYFGRQLPSVTWYPTDIDPISVSSINNYIDKEELSNVKSSYVLDVNSDMWNFQVNTLDIVVCINMIHISHWKCSQSLFVNSTKYLKKGGILFLYGPYMVNGVIKEASNQKFDLHLKERNKAWGLRDVEVLKQLGNQNKFHLVDIYDVAANNKILIFSYNP